MRWSLFLVFSIATVQLVFGQEKKTVLQIDGLPQYKKAFTQTFPDSTKALTELNAQLQQLRLNGYFEAYVEKMDLKNDSLKAFVIAGEKQDDLHLQNGNLPNALFSALAWRAKQEKITLMQLQKLRHNVLNYYQNNGFPFAQVWLDSLQEKEGQLSAQIFVSLGKEILIDTLRSVGSAKLSQAFLSTYLGLRKNEPYNESRVQNIEKRLRDLPFIALPKPPEVVFSGNSAKFNLFMDKQNANQFDGVVGFLPNPQSGKLQLSGDFKLNLKNALQNGETLDFNYRGLPSQSQELNLGLIYPYLFRSQLGIRANFQLFKRDTSFLNLSTKLAFDYSLNINKTLSFFVEKFNGNQVGEQQFQTIPRNANISSTFYGLALAYLKVDQKLVPMKGFDFNLQTSIGQRKITASQNFNPSDYFEKTKNQQFKLQADLKYYLKLGERSVFFARNNTAWLSGKSIFENEAFRIGGAKSLRGFDEQSLSVNTFSIQTTELRYFVEQNSYLNIFYDQAYIYQNFNDRENEDFPLGIGAGITFQTKIGITSLSYAIGKQKNIPLDLQKGKIHLGISSYF
ncbi:ShlB/FhaC/HecB family hemolysin secretion/activation protein [Pelobium manganitolerans]|uniref:ShlB/FhaC/HecB family hemolysin secretion/activation protein n=1 Tax=Pelobium manganitolerans TaxID=1842495 RepID=UPI003FA3A205